MATELKQTKNSFKLIGKVTRIDKDGAYKEDVMAKGKKQGETYRALRFGVKTSETNEVTVQMFDFEPEKVFLWNSDKKKENKNYKGEQIPFDEWMDKQDKLREDGYAVLQSRIGLTYGEDGKIESKGLPSFVASEIIYEELNNGDSVVIEGKINYSTYTNKQDKVVEQKNFKIEKVFKLKDVDFESEKFEEISYFEQQIVFIDAVADKPNNKVFVTGRTIDFAGNFHDTEFVVNYADADGNKDAGMVKLAEAFAKKIKFGDMVNVFGKIENRVIIEEKESDEDDSDDDLLAQLGGKSKPSHAQGYANRTYISEMQIEGIDAWDKKVYKEEDFVKQDIIQEEEEKNPLQEELGGKSKRDKNPFKDEIDSDEIDEDDLPF